MINPVSSTCFGQLFCPSSGAGDRQNRGCIILQAVTHSLLLLKMGKIFTRNMLSWLELLINKPLLLHIAGCIHYLYQWCTVKHISDNEIYFLIKYIKSLLWRAAKCLSYIEEARCLKVNIYSIQLYFTKLQLYIIILPFWNKCVSLFGIPKCAWIPCEHICSQIIAWRWLSRVETCSYKQNL